VGKDTLHQMLAHLEDAFLLSTVGLATDSARRRQVNPRKVYPVDTGLMALFDPSGNPNVDHALETAVLHELHRRGAAVDYVMTPGGFEVDFCARWPEGHVWLVQVCADLSDASTLARELRALEDARAFWPEARKMLVALYTPAVANLPPGIELHRATTWLLEAEPTRV
jgi:predicted AAA+ superfamily ATPase